MISTRIKREGVFFNWLGNNLTFNQLEEVIGQKNFGLEHSNRCTRVINNPNIATAAELLIMYNRIIEFTSEDREGNPITTDYLIDTFGLATDFVTTPELKKKIAA